MAAPVIGNFPSLPPASQVCGVVDSEVSLEVNRSVRPDSFEYPFV